MHEVESSNSKTAKPYTGLLTVRHRFNICKSSCVALVLSRGDENRKLVTRFSVIRRV